MKRTTVVFAVLLISVLLVSGAAAKRPPDPEDGPAFVLIMTGPPVYTYEPLGPDADPNDPETWKHVKIRDFYAKGIVTLFPGPNAGKGSFEYFENINFNPGQDASTEQGDLTLTFLGGPEGNDDSIGTIDVRFVGRATLTVPPDFPDHLPSITVTDQPWNIKGGTGEFSKIHGNGTRSTLFCMIEGEEFPCGVNYYGDIRY